jgi:hypothetical protein
MANSYITKSYLQTQFQNYTTLIKEKFALKSDVTNGVLEEDLTATTSIGSVTSGKTYTKGTKLEDIIRDILTTYQKAGLTVSLIPEDEIYDVVEDTLSSITISAATTKGTNNIISVTFYIDGVEMKEITEGVTDGGTFNYDHNFATPTNTTFIAKVSVSDGTQTTTVSKRVVFIGKSYYGTVAEDVVTPTEADIKGLQFNTLKNSQKLIYSEIQVDYGKVLYAYPKSLGVLAKIVDADNRDYTNSYTMSEVKVDGIEYYAYLLTDAMGTDNGYQSFL